MRFQTPLVPARLTRRYKRFLADASLEDGTEITAHCANPGSMMGLADPGTRIWLEPNEDPKKKLKFGWRLVEHESGHFTCVDTSIANRVVKQALEDRAIAEVSAYHGVRAEVPYAEKSRVDFLLTEPDLPDAYVEVKSVTLSRMSRVAEFPDSVTKRGAKHMQDLTSMCAAGHRACVLFLVQRTDATHVTLAADIDPTYAAEVRKARDAGVEILAYRTHLSPSGVTLDQSLPVSID